MEKIKNHGDPIDKILQRINVFVFDEKKSKEYKEKYGKDVKTFMLDPFLEDVFDNWFFSLPKNQQYAYLEDAVQLLHDFKIECANAIGERELILNNLESESYVELKEYVHGSLNRIFNKLENVYTFENNEIIYKFPELKEYGYINGRIDELQVLFEEMICNGNGDEFELYLMHNFTILCGEYRKLNYLEGSRQTHKYFPVGKEINIQKNIKEYIVNLNKVIEINSSRKIGTKKFTHDTDEGKKTYKQDMFEVMYKPYPDAETQIDTIPEGNLATLINGLSKHSDDEHQVIEYYAYSLINRTLVKEDYDKLFDSNTVITQGNIGDCFLINTLNSLRNNQYIEGFLSNSMEKLNDGDYKIKLPLGNKKNYKEIIVNSSDIKDNRLAEGDIGWKILEVAYLKLRAINNGISPYMKNSKKLNVEILNGGSLEEVTENFLGDLAYIKEREFEYYNKYSESKRTNDQEYEKYMKRVESRYDLLLPDEYGALPDLMVAAKFKSSYSEYVEDLSGNKVFLPNGHGYTVLELKSDSIFISNPHYPGNPFRLDKKTFLMSFDKLNVVDIDLEKFFIERYK